MSLPASLSGLMENSAYPHDCGDIELTETHISWVLLTGAFAYKLKKPVRFSFLDFSTLALREHFCREELRCNRAFAPELYVDVVPVYRHGDGSLSVGECQHGEIVEWAVQMHQFDPNAQLDRLLEHDQVTTGMLADFGRDLANRHAALSQFDGDANQAIRRIVRPVHDNFSEIAGTGLQHTHSELLGLIRQISDELGEELAPVFERRIQDGYIRECHGDLHLSNLVLLDRGKNVEKVVAFDCLEFNPDLRWIDTVSDVAFLFMDCHERGRTELAYAFLNAYLDASGDYPGIELLAYFSAYRSVVRAKVAALRWEQEKSAAAELRFVQHLEWARGILKRPRGRLIMMCGLSGAGKSWLARRLAPLIPAVRVRSDIVRKKLAGLTPLARTNSPVGGGLYAPQRGDETFSFIARVTESLLCRGENVLIDATFIESGRRAEFLDIANRLKVNATIVFCDTPVDVLRQRISQRILRDKDPSEATLEVLNIQLQRFAAPASPEPFIRVDTGKTLSDDELEALAATLAD